MSRKGSDSTVCQTLLDDGDLESDWTDRLAVVRLKQNNQTSDVETFYFTHFDSHSRAILTPADRPSWQTKGCFNTLSNYQDRFTAKATFINRGPKMTTLEVVLFIRF